MKRFVLASIVLILLVNSGVTLAKQDAPPNMPQKVREFLDRMTGTWKTGGTFEGTAILKWDSHKKSIIGNGQWTKAEGGRFNSWTELWSWDGETEDGVNAFWLAAGDHDIARGEIRGKVLSARLMKGKETVVGQSDVSSTKLRIEHHGIGQFTLSATNVLKNDEKQADMKIVFTRDIQELTHEVEVVHIGQKWSKAEMQVWKTVKAYWKVDTIDGLMAYIHAEFMGWSTDEPMPSNSAATRLWLGDLINTRTFEITTITPTGLKIHGNIAVVNYYYSQAYRDTEGKQQTERGRFTDILMKEEGKWLLIADHGGAKPASSK